MALNLSRESISKIILITALFWGLSISKAVPNSPTNSTIQNLDSDRGGSRAPREQPTIVSTPVQPTSQTPGSYGQRKPPKSELKATKSGWMGENSIQNNGHLGNEKISQSLRSTPPNETSISANRRAGQNGHFYWATMGVTCHPPSETIRVTVYNYRLWDQYGLGEDNYVNWNYLVGQFGRASVLNLISEISQKCMECDCETEIQDEEHQWGLKINDQSSACDTEENLRICQLIYGKLAPSCMCEEVLRFDDPFRIGGVLYKKHDMQHGRYFKGPVGHPNHFRTSGYDDEMSEEEDETEDDYMEGIDDFTLGRHNRWRASDTKEPYYLEGPQGNEGPRLNTLDGIDALDAGPGSYLAEKTALRYIRGSKSSLWKRERDQETSDIDSLQETQEKPQGDPRT
ncbi:hypothetical protein TWF718_004618 [Orbilia javanica]|uniref:Uncharacterized protein n=1 Tax=Orbilia javanica TaxID=47235 RepID=A0AAN8RL62_9PEZI